MTKDVLIKQISGINMEIVQLAPVKTQVRVIIFMEIFVLTAIKLTYIVIGPMNQNQRKRSKVCLQK